MDELSFTDKELEIFFNKFCKENLDIFNLILYFSSFRGDIIEFIERLKYTKDKICNEKSISIKSNIENDINLLNKKELELMSKLIDEAEFCASSDKRYVDEAKYLDYIQFIVNNALARSTKKKVLYI